MTPDPVERLNALIHEEREALLSGNYAALEPLAERKEALLEGIDPAEHDQADLVTLQDASARNEALLQIALDSIRQAGAEARSMRDRSQCLETYGPGGERRSLNAPVATGIRRA